MGQFPNPDTQWKPGQSGSPNGPGKGYKHLSTWIQELVSDDEFEYTVLEGGENPKRIQYKGAPLKAIIGVAIHKSLAGDAKWADWLAKYGYGSKMTLELQNPIDEILAKYGLKEQDAGQTPQVTDGSPKDTV